MSGLSTPVTIEQWRIFDEQGFVKLGKIVPDEMLEQLKRRMTDIMHGRADVDYSQLMMQLDSATGRYEDIGPQTLGFKGRSDHYRKIQNLEHDPVILNFIRQPVFDSACRWVYGEQEPIASFRTMFFNKPPAPEEGKWGGTALPWHQDSWLHLDRDPQLTVLTAIDLADKTTGCVWAIPGSHKFGQVSTQHHSGFLAPNQHRIYCPVEKAVPIELRPGEVCLLHNWTIHMSGVNASSTSPRRALSVNYMSANTRLVPHNQQVGGNTTYAEGSDRWALVFPRLAKARL
eukprot:TRINITY_DN51248_c0_g1_i1.p2 TRINITY_DN51248_c0_g1~~TRINITY_DN51248_c0_g1_i1.p2  ORF type:complete len:313 (+),score=126.67 TRINITY_DN51248_c0_g1_i1:80-940(+)